MDWNWFFTAIAQCSAAIVGFIGGFIITKILSSEIEYNNITLLFDDLNNKINHQKRLISIRSFDWYNSRIRENVRRSDKYELLVRKDDDSIDYACIMNLDYSPYDNLSSIKEEIAEDWGSYSTSSPLISSTSNLAHITMYNAIHDQLIEERELIDREYVNTSALSDEINKNVKLIERFDYSTSSYQFVIWVLIVLFL